VNEGIWLCANKTLFIKIGDKLDLLYRPLFVDLRFYHFMNK
jgi:hypothetical protein